MLWLSCRRNESIVIGDELTVESHGGIVRVGVESPAHIEVTVESHGGRVRVGIDGPRIYRSFDVRCGRRPSVPIPPLEVGVGDEESAGKRAIGGESPENKPVRKTTGLVRVPSHGYPPYPQKVEQESQHAEQLAKERDLWRDKHHQLLERLDHAEHENGA